jgi:HEAT repeat protein
MIASAAGPAHGPPSIRGMDERRHRTHTLEPMGDAGAAANDLAGLIERWAALVKATSDDPPESILQPPATETAIAALEERLGVALPPSYRAFLALSDGAAAFPIWGLVGQEPAITGPTGLRSTATVDWIRNGDRSMVAIWTGVAGEPTDPDDHPLYVARVPEREYLLGGFVEHLEGGSEKGGHLRHVLAISSCVDGYASYLNPLVVDADGEWEAWDFGTKTLGAVRYASFRDLIAADIDQLEARIQTADATDIDAQLAVLEDRTRPPQERVSAAYGLFGREGVNERIAAAIAEIALDAGVEVQVRQSAIQVLGYTQTGTAISTIARLVADPNLYVRMATISPLAASSEPAAVAATRTVLTDPEIPTLMLGSIYRCNEGVWEAWQERREPLLLAALAGCGDERAIEPLVEGLRDPEVPDEVRSRLISAVSARFRDDARLVPALLAASRFQIGHARVHTAGTLLRLGATDEAIAMYRDAAIELGVQGWGASESSLGQMTDPAADEALLAVLAAQPTTSAIDALGWHPSPAAVAAIEPWLDDPAMHLVGIDALERMATPEAIAVLARRSWAGDVLATRALARFHDSRALAPLLEMLASPDAATAFRGADGLRDLRDPAATEALLAAVGHPDPDVAVCATHALVSMASPTTPEALDRLAANPDSQARALAVRWQGIWRGPSV